MRPALRYGLAALIVCLVQTAALGYMVFSRASILRSGAEVMLRTAPVDPRDLLRGDYVILSYDISIVPASVITGPWPAAESNQRLWVRLVKGADGSFTISEAAFQPLAAQEGSVVMRSLPFTYRPFDAHADQRVDYGIERYYVPEGEGRELEQARDLKAMTVAVKVSQDGEAQLRALFIDGKMVYEEPLY